MPKLIFVYAVDSGWFNAISDYAHKVISPNTYACNLCAVTNTMLGMKREWAQFLRDTGYDTQFLHRDEFKESYPTGRDTLPAVFRSVANETPQLLISSKDINACNDLAALIALVGSRLT